MAIATQARLRGEEIGLEQGHQAPSAEPTTNGDNNALANSNGDMFSVPIRADDRHDDPNDQLEQEMRQAGAPRDNDVSMSG